MRVLIQERGSEKYLRLPDEWVSNHLEGTDFHDTVNALRVAMEIKVRKLDVALIFEDRRYDMRIPVSDR